MKVFLNSSGNFFVTVGEFLWNNTAKLLMFALLAYVVIFIVRYILAERPVPGTTEWIGMRDRPKMLFLRPGQMEKKDWLYLGIVTLVYAIVTFTYLGNLKSPVTFYQFNQENQSVTIELNEPVYIDKVRYFTGLYHSHSHNSESTDCCYILELSEDGVTWYKQYDMHQSYAETFRWKIGYINTENYPPQTKYLRISLGNTNGPLEMGEFALYAFDENNQSYIYPAEKMTVSESTAACILDENTLVPEHEEVINSSHFDEIYHARTAYEHVIGEYPYETTHPPLGKLTTALGIKLFGMTPFGWRFMPALFGVLMLPLLFVLIKWMFDKTLVAVCGTVLFAADFMHFTQTRISTIDVYAVFYILAMYLFMYWYFTSQIDAPFRKSALPFFLSGLSFGIGAASKWVCIYAGAGLLALFVIALVRRYRHCRQLQTIKLEEEKAARKAEKKNLAASKKSKKKSAVRQDSETPPNTADNESTDGQDGEKPMPAIPPPQPAKEIDLRFAPFLLKSIALGMLSFVVIPVLIYSASYIPYALARPSTEMKEASENGNILLQSAALVKGTWDECIRNQQYMFDYHAGLESTHYYSSRWYDWVFGTRGILYFRHGYEDGEVINLGNSPLTVNTARSSSLTAFNNPLVIWTGLVALIFSVFGITRRNSSNALFILIGFASNFLPWMLISRLTFPYHYFPSVIFLCLALSYIFHRILERNPFNRRPIIKFTIVAVALFILFYPAISGLPAPDWYFQHFLRWFPSTGFFCWPM